MMEAPNRFNTLYLPIKQVYFDAILAGTKKVEYREVKEGLTANKYLIKDPGSISGYKLNPAVATDPARRYYVDDYINGGFPFLPREYKYLNLAVGYAKERDTALVEVVGYSFTPDMVREDRDGVPRFAFWTLAYHLGRVVQVHRKGQR